MESKLLCLARSARGIVTVPTAMSWFIEWEEGRNIKEDLKGIESKYIGLIAWHMSRYETHCFVLVKNIRHFWGFL